MKKFFLLLAVLLMVSGTAMAQVPKPFTFYIGAGVDAPTSDFGDLYKMGFHGLGAVGYNAAPMISILGKVEYHSLGSDVDGLLDGSFTGIMFGAAARVTPQMPTSSVKPFGLAGIGFCNGQNADVYNLSTAAFEQPESSTDMYFELGGGVEFAAGPSLNLFLQGRYVNVNGDGYNYTWFPLTVGVKF